MVKTKALSHISITITNGNGSELAIDEHDFLVARFVFGRDNEVRVNLGACTQDTIQILKSNLDRLKVHAR